MSGVVSSPVPWALCSGSLRRASGMRGSGSSSGAYGYMKEAGIERDLRDAVAGTIYSGTSEIQRVILSRMLGL
jgi:alkylation response protein AidB-like acyl-CoA dehydrogenase